VVLGLELHFKEITEITPYFLQIQQPVAVAVALWILQIKMENLVVLVAVLEQLETVLVLAVLETLLLHHHHRVIMEEMPFLQVAYKATAVVVAALVQQVKQVKAQQPAETVAMELHHQ
jgi:hypothetical protein